MFRNHLLITACVSAASVGTAQAGLVAHYSFDSDYSLTAGSYAGTLSESESGGATVGISSAAADVKFGGGAASYSSGTGNAAFLALSADIEFAANEAWSAAFWVRRAAGSDQRQGMVAGDTSNSTDFLWASDNPSQVQGMRFRNSSNQTADFGGFADDGNYHHWVVISDGAGTISVYRDNVALTPQAHAGNFSINAIGHAYNQNTFSMNGQIDEFYLFDEAIDSGVVDSLFSNNAVPEPTSFALLGLGGLCVLRRRR